MRIGLQTKTNIYKAIMEPITTYGAVLDCYGKDPKKDRICGDGLSLTSFQSVSFGTYTKQNN